MDDLKITDAIIAVNELVNRANKYSLRNILCLNGMFYLTDWM